MLRCIEKNIIVNNVGNNEYEKNGIIIKNSENSNIIGNVMCVGSNVKDISVGDKVIYSESDAKRIVHEGTELFVLNEKDVLAII